MLIHDNIKRNLLNRVQHKIRRPATGDRDWVGWRCLTREEGGCVRLIAVNFPGHCVAHTDMDRFGKESVDGRDILSCAGENSDFLGRWDGSHGPNRLAADQGKDGGKQGQSTK
jgi:hypothetical protein